jgi:hypothetical protein
MPPSSRARILPALLLLAGLGGAPGCHGDGATADGPLDLGATDTSPCPAHATCWSFPAQADGWTVGGRAAPDASGLGVAAADGAARLLSPRLRARGRTALAVRLRASVDLRVVWTPVDGTPRPLAQWKRPQPWWIDRWHAVEIPQDETGRITIEGITAPSGPPGTTAFSISAAELLRDGRGRCHRDDWVGIAPPMPMRCGSSPPPARKADGLGSSCSPTTPPSPRSIPPRRSHGPKPERRLRRRRRRAVCGSPPTISGGEGRWPSPSSRS